MRRVIRGGGLAVEESEREPKSCWLITAGNIGFRARLAGFVRSFVLDPDRDD